jgi:hypothetical protein
MASELVLSALQLLVVQQARVPVQTALAVEQRQKLRE